MSEPRISNLEKEVEVIKATVNPLIGQIQENTKANVDTQKAIVGLTHEIKSMVSKFDSTNENVKDLDDRVTALERKDSYLESGRELGQWIKRAIAVGLTSAVLTGIGFIVSLYFKSGA